MSVFFSQFPGTLFEYLLSLVSHITLFWISKFPTHILPILLFGVNYCTFSKHSYNYSYLMILFYYISR